MIFSFFEKKSQSYENSRKNTDYDSTTKTQVKY